MDKLAHIRESIVELAIELALASEDDNVADETFSNLAVALYAIDDRLTYGRGGAATDEQITYMHEQMNPSTTTTGA